MQDIIKLMKENNWIVDIKNVSEIVVVLNLAEMAGFNTENILNQTKMILVNSDKNKNLGTAIDDGGLICYNYNDETIKQLNMKNITNEVFNSCDIMDRLVPVGINEQMYVNAILGWLRGYGLEVLENFNEVKWVDKLDSLHNGITLFFDSEYRIKKADYIPKELWKWIKNNYVWINENRDICSSNDRPQLNYSTGRWETNYDNVTIINLLDVNITGINWAYSLLTKPKDIK